MTVSVIIKTHNSEPFIHKAIQALDRQTVKPDEIIIMDSASKDPSYLDQYKNRDDIWIMITREDVGFCKGNNMGFQVANPQNPYILFLNPDAYPEPDVIEKGLQKISENTAILTGVLHGYDNEKNQPTGRYDSTGIFRTWYGRWHDRDQGKPLKDLSRQELPAICGAFMFCKREALKEVLIDDLQVFDESFFMYKEDIDLSLRLRKKGWKLELEPSMIIYHCRGWKSRKQTTRTQRLHSARNELKVHTKHKCPHLAYSLAKWIGVKVLDL